MNYYRLGAVMVHVIVALLATSSQSAAALPSWTTEIRLDHPRLFFNSDTWPAVRDRALNQERQWYDHIKHRVDNTLERLAENETPEAQELGPEAAQAAFVFLMTDDPKYLQLAKKCLDTSLRFYDHCYEQKKSVNWYSTSRVHATLAWDWTYNHLSDAERRDYMSRLVQAVDHVLKARPAIYRENMSGYQTGFYGVRNSQWFIGCTAYGTGIETELVNEWLEWGYEENMRLLAHRKRACGDDGGSASPTLGYAFGAYPWAEQNFFYTWLSATGQNIASDWPHGAWLTNYVIWNWIAAEPDPLEFGYGDTPHVTNRLPTRQLYTHMANIRHLYKDAAPDAAALARHIQDLVPNPSYSNSYFIYPFLLTGLEASPARLSPDQLPRARHFETMGQLFMRSGSGPEDTYCLFTCGGILRQHRHFDALNFVIYHRGFLALDSGTRYLQFDNGQHLANYFAQTVAHNCVLIHQPGEPAANYWGGTVESNHGGQHRQLGSVVKAFETNDHFVYVAGDATSCYQHGADGGEKCQLVTRQLVFLMPNHFVICDRVRTTQPEYRKQWLLHTAHKPTIQDRTIRADHGEGRLFCRTLLPADVQLTAVGGDSNQFFAAGKNWDIVSDGLDSEARALMGQWRVEVTPRRAQQDDLFLHVLQVGPQTTKTMNRVSLIEKEGVRGARVQTDDGVWEVTFQNSGPLAGHIRHTGGQKLIDQPLSRSVQPQQGLMLKEN